MTEITRTKTGKRGRRVRGVDRHVFDPRLLKNLNDQDMSKHTIRAVGDFHETARTHFLPTRLPDLGPREPTASDNFQGRSRSLGATLRGTAATDDWRLH